MGLVIGTILSFIFLEPPWRYVVIVPLAAWEAFEVMLWLKWRQIKSITGVEAFAGTTGRALTDCRPDGQVRVRGAVWRAHCPQGVDAGDHIVVESIDGLVLTVGPRSIAARDGDEERRL